MSEPQSSGRIDSAAYFKSHQDTIGKLLAGLQGHQVSVDEFETFVEALLARPDVVPEDILYGRLGFALVTPLDRLRVQVVACQVNNFGAGVFGPKRVRFCTPLLLTLQLQPKRRYAPYSPDETPVVVKDLYLGKRFCGSKGELCNRDKFLAETRRVLIDEPCRDAANDHLLYEVMNTNYICHHIAETLGYALGGTEIYGARHRTPLLLLAGSRFDEAAEKLFIETADDFAGEEMCCRFELPRYEKLGEDPTVFRETCEPMLCEVTYRGATEFFSMPAGFQKESLAKEAGRVNFITTQHILHHLMQDYYYRANASILTNTFQTLEYLSRGFIARREGHPERCAAFLRRMTTCLGYYPERDFTAYWRDKAQKFDSFDRDIYASMFFRPPVLL